MTKKIIANKTRIVAKKAVHAQAYGPITSRQDPKPKKLTIAKKPKTSKKVKNIKDGQVKEWVQRLREVGCKVDVPINIMLEWDSGSDLDLWAKCMCGKWIGYSNMKCA